MAQLTPPFGATALPSGDAPRPAADGSAAIKAKELAVQARPQDAKAWHSLGIACIQAGQFAQSVDAIERAILLDGAKATFRNNLGVALLGQRNWPAAHEAFEKAVALDPRYVDALANLGLVSVNLAKLGEAARFYRQALEIQPQHVGALFNLANLLLEQGRADEAVVLYRQALDLRPQRCDILNNLGRALLEKGQTGEAISCFDRALQVDPGFGEAAFNAGKAYAQQEKLAEAEERFEAAACLRPGKGIWRWQRLGLCSTIFQSEAELDDYRADLDRRLDRALSVPVRIDVDELAWDGVVPSFNLAHHGRSNRRLFEKFAALYRPHIPKRNPAVHNRDSVNIPDGDSSATIDVAPLDAHLYGGSKSLTVDLQADSGGGCGGGCCGCGCGGGSTYTLGSPDSATMTISDDDTPPTITITATQDGAESGTDGIFEISRNTSAGNLSINYTFNSGSSTAVSGTDFNALSGSVTIPDGASSVDVHVTPIDQSLYSGSKTVEVDLANTSCCSDGGNYSIGSPSTATLSIVDDDVNPVTVTNPGSQTNYDGDVVSLPVSATDSLGNTLSYTVSGLPSGLGINSSTGAISGTIASNADLGSSYSVKVTATDYAANASMNQSFTWTILPVTVSLTSPGTQTNNDSDAVSLQLSATDTAGRTPVYTMTSGSLPSGLSLTSTGAISGTISANADAIGSYSATITATDTAVNVSSSTTIAWQVGLPTFELTGQHQVLLLGGSVAAGTRFRVSVLVLNADGLRDANYRGTVAFSSSDAEATLPGIYTFNAVDSGYHGFTNGFTLGTAGQQTINALDANNNIRASISYTVTPGPVAHFQLLAPLVVLPSTPFSATVVATDKYGNPYGSTAPAYTGTIHFATDDTAAGVSLPANYQFTAADAGRHTFSVTLVTVEACTSLTVTDTANATISSPDVCTSVCGDAVGFKFSVPTGPIFPGEPFVVAITAVDANGVIALGYTGTLYIYKNTYSSGDSIPMDVTISASDLGQLEVDVTFGSQGALTFIDPPNGLGDSTGTIYLTY